MSDGTPPLGLPAYGALKSLIELTLALIVFVLLAWFLRPRPQPQPAALIPPVVRAAPSVPTSDHF